MIGTTFSHYRILEKLGEGGMGVVYKALDLRLERYLALKFLPNESAANPAYEERFIREAQAASALNHPNVAVVYDVGRVGDQSFIAFELIEGENLRAHLKAAPFSIDRVQAISVQLAEGLRAAHEKGIVHRDIKPENLLLGPGGRLKIMDFGIARVEGSDLTATGLSIGTLGYMSPEQFLGDKVDHRSDLWAVGVVMYEMLVGRRPHAQSQPAALMYEVLNKSAVPIESLRPETPAAMAALVGQLLQKDPERRPPSAEAVIELLTKAPPPRASGGASLPPDKSIAVLYFENMSADPENEYYCAGITEDILTDLSKVEGMHVASRTDMLPFKGKQVNIRQVAQALRVNYVLEGSVRKAGQRVRITAQVIDARNGYHVWADRFDGLVDDIFELQAEVASQIARALKGSLSPADERDLARKPTRDVRAYDFYMRGRDYLSRRGKANTESALRMFDQAIELDPDFAGVYAARGEACADMYEWYDGHADWLSRSISANEDALARAPESLEARYGIAVVFFHQGRFDEARRELEAVLTAREQHVEARIRLGIIAERTATGPAGVELAASHFRRATEIRPNDEVAWQYLAGACLKLGRQEEAHDAMLTVIEITSRKLEASLEDVVVLSHLGVAYARVGAREEALATAQRAHELAPSDGLVLYNCACAYVLLGEADPGLAMLRRSYECGFRGVINMARTAAAFDGLQHHPGFQRLIAELT